MVKLSDKESLNVPDVKDLCQSMTLLTRTLKIIPGRHASIALSFNMITSRGLVLPKKDCIAPAAVRWQIEPAVDMSAWYIVLITKPEYAKYR